MITAKAFMDVARRFQPTEESLRAMVQELRHKLNVEPFMLKIPKRKLVGEDFIKYGPHVAVGTHFGYEGLNGVHLVLANFQERGYTFFVYVRLF